MIRRVDRTHFFAAFEKSSEASRTRKFRTESSEASRRTVAFVHEHEPCSLFLRLC